MTKPRTVATAHTSNKNNANFNMGSIVPAPAAATVEVSTFGGSVQAATRKPTIHQT